MSCVVAALVLNFPLSLAQEARHRTLKTEGIKLPRKKNPVVHRDAVKANSRASKKNWKWKKGEEIKPLDISPEKNAAFKAFEGPELPISHQMPPVGNPEAVAKHNEEVVARLALDKNQPGERNLDTPVTAKSEDVALFTDTHSDYTLGLKSLILVIMCPGGHDCENDVRSLLLLDTLFFHIFAHTSLRTSIIHIRFPLTGTTPVLSIVHISTMLKTIWIFWSDIITTFT